MENFDKNQVWHEVLESIKVSVSPAIFSTWLSQTHLAELQKITDNRFSAEIGCASTFVKSTVEIRYFGLIQDSLTKSLRANCDLIFSVKQKPATTQTDQSAPLFDQNENGYSKNSNVVIFFENIGKSKVNPSLTFENYAVSGSNQMAWAAAEAVAQKPGSAYNPLFMWGGVGVGKTHLMNAVGLSIIKDDPDAKVLKCTGEEFTNDIVEGIRNKTTQNFRNKYRKLQGLLIDDIQFIAGKDTVQEEFFHTFNAVTQAGGQVILTSDRPPQEISKLEERLRSRFEAGLIVDIGQPDFELRCAITQIKAKDRGLDIPMDLVQIIASNIESARKIEGFLTRLVSEVKLKNVPLTEELINNILSHGHELKEQSKKTLSPDQVIERVCSHFSVSKRAILSKTRTRTIARPRQILMYILRIDAGLPLEEVGKMIGGRDHTTVMHAVNTITKLASIDVNIREDIMGIKKSL
ncbi:chromosomal replication initiator protein DnaA [Candidatus Microgenomates bacterium]|nr:chromosomal replication initiator protein DnaA [Candidatus Microgenomates bacterium]